MTPRLSDNRSTKSSALLWMFPFFGMVQPSFIDLAIRHDRVAKRPFKACFGQVCVRQIAQIELCTGEGEGTKQPKRMWRTQTAEKLYLRMGSL